MASTFHGDAAKARIVRKDFRGLLRVAAEAVLQHDREAASARVVDVQSNALANENSGEPISPRHLDAGGVALVAQKGGDARRFVCRKPVGHDRPVEARTLQTNQIVPIVEDALSRRSESTIRSAVLGVTHDDPVR
jgi:hypothetical protein